MSQALDALIERANTYRDTVCQETGARPTVFPVTEQEYTVLLRDCRFQDVPVDCLPHCGEVYIAGMRVVVPERLRDEHLWEALGVPPDVVGFGTTAPTRHFRHLFDTGLIDWLQAQAITTMERSRRPAAVDLDDPLPPLEGLDEGLQCCGLHYETFAKYLAHQKQAHVMR